MSLLSNMVTWLCLISDTLMFYHIEAKLVLIKYILEEKYVPSFITHQKCKKNQPFCKKAYVLYKVYSFCIVKFIQYVKQGSPESGNLIDQWKFEFWTERCSISIFSTFFQKKSTVSLLLYMKHIYQTGRFVEKSILWIKSTFFFVVKLK